MTLVDFADFGVDYPVPIDTEELNAIWWGAQRMLEESTAEELRSVIERWELCLNYTALTGGCLDDQWYTRALLCIAVLGLLGDRAPRFHETRHWH